MDLLSLHLLLLFLACCSFPSLPPFGVLPVYSTLGGVAALLKRIELWGKGAKSEFDMRQDREREGRDGRGRSHR